MRRSLQNRNRQCKRCDMPLLALDMHCAFCGRMAPLVPLLHVVKVGAAALLSFAIGLPTRVAVFVRGFVELLPIQVVSCCVPRLLLLPDRLLRDGQFSGLRVRTMTAGQMWGSGG